jgi:tetratricopeptide (TPR) repeat protein
VLLKIFLPSTIFTFLPLLVLANPSPVCLPVDYSKHSQYGPIDYYAPENNVVGAGGRKEETNVTIVTNYHFDKNVLALKRGVTGEHVKGDLDYTLRAVPNLPFALDTASRLELRRASSKEYAKKQPSLPFTAECYFERAVSIFGSPNPQTLLVWGIHKFRMQDYQGALEKYKMAEELSPVNAELAYNMGLVYLKLNNPKAAEKYADIAYSQGYPLQGLANLINKAKEVKN